MVVLPGVEGELGILPLHVPLMTRLLPGEVRILQGGKQTELVVGTGFVEVLADPRFDTHRHGDGRHGDRRSGGRRSSEACGSAGSGTRI